MGPSDLPPRPDDEALQYTHSGRRYLLGYGRDFFGIWERAESSSPVWRYPRTDEGWRAAWLAFVAAEPDHVEVGLMGGTPARVSTGQPDGTIGATAPRRRISGAWWLLPILLGWIGGLVAWLINKDVDPERSRAMLITGVALSVGLFVLFVLANATAPTSP
jgi:hypothetical protein